jgi:hypothetical protein
MDPKSKTSILLGSKVNGSPTARRKLKGSPLNSSLPQSKAFPIRPHTAVKTSSPIMHSLYNTIKETSTNKNLEAELFDEWYGTYGMDKSNETYASICLKVEVKLAEVLNFVHAVPSPNSLQTSISFECFDELINGPLQSYRRVLKPIRDALWKAIYSETLVSVRRTADGITPSIGNHMEPYFNKYDELRKENESLSERVADMQRMIDSQVRF